jgi:hypothetical protein
MEKRTPKEVANFLDRPVALDSVRGIARWFWYDEVHWRYDLSVL